MATMTCEICGQMAFGKRVGARYCSIACKNIAYRNRRNQRDAEARKHFTENETIVLEAINSMCNKDMTMVGQYLATDAKREDWGYIMLLIYDVARVAHNWGVKVGMLAAELPTFDDLVEPLNMLDDYDQLPRDDEPNPQYGNGNQERAF